MLHRRSLILSSLASGLLLPKMSKASTGERKFLFLFCPGGWDQCAFAAPLFDSYYVNMNTMGERSSIGGITFVDHPEHPSLYNFLQKYASKTVLINGVESRSVAHDVCVRLMYTSASDTEHDDWASIIAAHAQNNFILPNVVLSGPSFGYLYSDKVLRVGEQGQLQNLLNLTTSVQREELEDLYVQQMLSRHESHLATIALEKEMDINEIQNSALLNEGVSGNQISLSNRLNQVAQLFAQDQAKVISLAYDGVGGLGWDTHAGIHMQHWHLDELFSSLDSFLDTLSQTNAPSGNTLIDEVTIVVFSEMGRFPRLNFRDGRDHWTFTSLFMMGAGIEGGQTIGGYDEYCLGQPTDLLSGQIQENGTLLTPKEIGATLLTLADIDHKVYLDSDPIQAILKI